MDTNGRPERYNLYYIFLEDMRQHPLPSDRVCAIREYVLAVANADENDRER